MKILRNLLLSTAAAALLAPGFANANATWRVNYEDANSAGGSGITLFAPTSVLIDEYLYTAESLVMFNDGGVGGAGVISAGDTFVDVIAFTINSLALGSVVQSAPEGEFDYPLKNVQISGILTATGTQVTNTSYTVDTANIEFWFDGIGLSTGGTTADFATLSTIVDGVLVQTGAGAGTGSNGELFPDGNIDIFFELTDVLSGLSGCLDDDEPAACAPFELFDPFTELDNIIFATDSNNLACQASGGTADCASTVASLESFFEVDTEDFDFFFQTQSNGSAIKAVPEPGSIALLGLGLMGLGFARRKAKS